MRTNKEDERAFTVEIGKLRVLSTELRKEEHDKFINWIDINPMRDGSVSEVMTIVLPTRGCKFALAWHGGCTMCSLPSDNPRNPSESFVKSFAERSLTIFNRKGGSERFKGIKFYTSGSFLDPWELPVDVRDDILITFKDIVDEITIETRCEFVLKKHLGDILKIISSEKLVVAIGQESTDDEINKRSINKGHSLKQFTRAVSVLHQFNIQVKGYILLKPIFISEIQAYDDAIQSAKDMHKLGVQNISINPSYIGKGTLMDAMFKQRNYQPPWLWTVFNVTKDIKSLVGNAVRVISDPVAAGSERGPRNCGNCDSRFKRILKEFSSTQDLELLNKIECECKKVYDVMINSEHLKNGHGINSPYN